MNSVGFGCISIFFNSLKMGTFRVVNIKMQEAKANNAALFWHPDYYCIANLVGSKGRF